MYVLHIHMKSKKEEKPKLIKSYLSRTGNILMMAPNKPTCIVVYLLCGMLNG